MDFPGKYKFLGQQVFIDGPYSLVPIRYEDRFNIMKWRNEQIYHLRQDKLLTSGDQEAYFQNVVSKLFDQQSPVQALFSYLENGVCIGYGGLVHINWIDKNAEISFIMDTALEKDFFEFHWLTFLSLLEKVAFGELQFHKIFTYAFDLRTKLYEVLEKSGYEREARLNEHCLFDGKYFDVVIHSKIRKQIYLRDANIADLQITYDWANSPHTRRYSFNRDFISFEKHREWFSSKLADKNCIYKLLVIEEEVIGSIRMDSNDGEAVISYLISPDHAGQGFGKKILELALSKLKKEHPEIKLVRGLVKKDNIASIKIFDKLEFEKTETTSGVFEYKKIIKHADR